MNADVVSQVDAGVNPARAMEDFPDWISPMLVKELRQGMRARVFLSSFLVIQAAMMLLAIIGLANWDDQNSMQGVTVFFWIIIGAPLLFVMPLSGMNAISGERRANTLDLIFLTRLSSRRIVVGKWLAIVGQTALLVTAILPYLVLRYYIGGVDLMGELRVIALLFLASAVMTGIAVAISPSTGRIGRALIPVVMILGSQIVSVVASDPFGVYGGGMGGGRPAAAWESAAIYLFMAAVFIYCMLETGAGRIAPAAENHSTGRRLAALSAVLFCSVHASLMPGLSWSWTLSSLILIPVCIGAVCEPEPEVASLFRPFVRLGKPGRALGLLFSPGWPSGVLYSLALLAVLYLAPHSPFMVPGHSHATGATVRIHPRPPQPVLHLTAQPTDMIFALAGALLLPAACLRLIPLRWARTLGAYLGFQVVCLVLMILSNALAGTGEGWQIATAWLPLCYLWRAGGFGAWPPSSVESARIGMMILTGFAILILFVKMIPCWKRIFALEKKAAAQLAQRREPNAVPAAEPA